MKVEKDAAADDLQEPAPSGPEMVGAQFHNLVPTNSDSSSSSS